MKLSKKYVLDPELDTPIRKLSNRGNFSAAAMFITLPIAASLFTYRFGTQALILFEVVALMVFVTTINSFGRAVASMRIQAARKMKQAHRPDQIIAALQWFAGGWLASRSVHDPTGEAFYTLGRAAKECGEEELLELCKKQLSRVKTGPWAKKASKL